MAATFVEQGHGPQMRIIGKPDLGVLDELLKRIDRRVGTLARCRSSFK